MLAAGSLLATVFTFLVALTVSDDLGTFQDDVSEGLRFAVGWLGLCGLGCLLVAALLLRMRVFYPVAYNAPVFDVLSALMAAVTCALVLLIFLTGNAARGTLWLALLFGAIGFLPMVIVMQPPCKPGSKRRW